MTRLVKVELRRLFARRLTLVGIAGALVIVGLMLFATYKDAQPLSAPEQQRAQREYEQARAEWERSGPEQIQNCKLTERSTLPDGSSPCDHLEPRPEYFGKPKTVFNEVMPDYLTGLSYLAAFVAFLIGAGFFGAEFSTGSIGNWLTFEPRRLRVYGSKLLAAAAGPVPIAAVLLAVLTGGCWLIIDHLGTTAGTGWSVLAGIAWRTVVLAAAAGLLGSVSGGLLRHTAAGIGLAMGYMVIVEGILAHALQKSQPWLLKLNVDSWVRHGAKYYVEDCDSAPDGGYFCSSVEKTVSFGHSATYLAVVAAAMVLLGALVFRRRDIT